MRKAVRIPPSACPNFACFDVRGIISSVNVSSTVGILRLDTRSVNRGVQRIARMPPAGRDVATDGCSFRRWHAYRTNSPVRVKKPPG